MSVFFEHQGLSYELPDGTTPDVAIQKIKQHLGQTQSKSLVDQIPGLALEVKQPPEDTSPLGVLSHVGNSLGSGLETIGAVGTGLTSGMAGSILGGWNALTSGRDFVKGMHEGGDALTYQPRLDQAQSDTANINEELNRVLAPMMGHMSGFAGELPRYYKGLKVKEPRPNIEPTIPNPKEALNKSASTIVERKLNLIKEREQEIQSSFVDGTASPELQKESEFLYQQRLKLEADLHHLDILSGKVKVEDSLPKSWSLEEKQKRYDDLKSLANSGVKLTDRQIELFDSLGLELERAKAPLEPTARPLEALKTEEPIPTPTPTKESVLERFKKPSEEIPPGNVNWDRSQEWKSDNVPSAESWRIQKEIQEAEYNRLVDENIKAKKAAEQENEFLSNQPPPSKYEFQTKEALHNWLDQQRNDTIAQIKRVQDLLNWAKENSTSKNKIETIQLKNKTVTIEDLNAARDNLNRQLEDLTNKKNKSLFSAEDLDPNLPPKVHIPEGAKYKPEAILKRLDGVIRKYESLLQNIRDRIYEDQNGVSPSGGTLFKFKGDEYGVEAAKGLEAKLTETYNRLINNRDKIQKSQSLRNQEKVRQENTKRQEAIVSQIKRAQKELIELEKTAEPVHEENITYYPELIRKQEEINGYKAELKKQNKAKDLSTIDPSLSEGDTVTPNVKYDSIGDILLAERHPIDSFINNPELFDTVPGKDTHVDKVLTQQMPKITEIVDTFVKDLGLDSDKIYIIDSKDRSFIKFYGNSAIIHISLDDLMKNATEFYYTNPKTKSIVGTLSPENYKHFMTAKVVAHEFGHYVFTKWLKFDNVTGEKFSNIINGFNNWAKTNKIEPITWITALSPDIYRKYHSVFDEYFAERVSNALIRTTLLDKFSDKKSSLYTQIQTVVNSLTSWLQKQGIKLSRFDIVEDLIQDIRNRNAESIKESGRTLWNKLETEQNDKLILEDRNNTYPFANKTLEDIRKKPFEVFDKDDNPVAWQRSIGEAQSMPDIVNFSSKALDAIGASGPWIARNIFGKTTLAGIFKNNPIIQKAHYIIRDAERRASDAANNLWYLNVSMQQWKDAPIWQRFSKVKLPDSPWAVHKSLTNLEAYRLHEVYKQGWEAKLTYDESLDKFGQHLTEKEKNAYKVFGSMMERAFTHQKSLEMSLGKKDIIQRSPGYYPALRRGDYFTSIIYGDNIVHRQHFGTRVAAEAWVKKMESQIGNHYEIGPIENITDAPKHPGTFDMMNILDDYLYNKHNIDISREANQLKEKLIARGGKMGHHHEQRFNISGYKGSELGFTPEELGHSFKQGIQDYVQEFQSQYKNMIIQHEINPMLETLGLKDSHPQTHAAIEQMKFSAINVNVNKVKAFDTAVYETSDRIARGIYEALYPGKLFNPKDPVYKTAQGAAISTFYLMKVLPSLPMAITQLLTPFAAMRHGAIDNGFLTIGSFGKGMFKLLTKDKELMQSLFEVTQTTDIIEPQFIQTLHMKGENKVFEFLKDWVAMRKPQEACDILSRTLGYAYFYTHYKDIGHSPIEARNLALEGIDANFGAYTRGETAPMFQKLGGIIGEGMRPLQTFGQMVVGNLVADVKRMADNPTQLKAYAPFIMYALTTTLLGGAVTGPIMNQYESLRQFFMRMYPEMKIPSTLDLIAKGAVSLDGIVEDPEALTKLAAYGVLSQQTGIDIGASARTTETLPGTLLSVALATVQGDEAATEMAKETSRLLPVHSNIVHTVHGGYTLGKNVIKDVPDNELKQAITDFSMRGPMKNALMEATGANKTTVMGQKTNNIASGTDSSMLMEEGPKEKLAHWMDSMSTEERFKTDQKLEASIQNKAYNDKIKQMFILYNKTMKPEYLNRLIELGATDKNIKSQLEARAYKALVPADLRDITKNKGKVPNTPTTIRKLEQQRIFNFGGR